MVKNLPTMWETWVRSLGWEDPLEKGKVTQPGEFHGLYYIVHGVAKSRTRLSDFHFTSFRMYSVSTSRLKTTAPSLTILCIHAKSLQSDSLQPYGLSLPGSSVHGILQARILAWVAMPYTRGSSRPRDQS